MIKKAEIIKKGNLNLDWTNKVDLVYLSKYNRVLGEFIGTLKGVCCWDIPNELKLKLERKIKELEKK